MEQTTYHIPVLLQPAVAGLNIRKDGTYVDVTYGGGGHSKEILRQLGPSGQLYSFDQDADAWTHAMMGDKRSSAEGAETGHFTFVQSNFRYLKNWMRYYGVDGIDGLLADLGVSSHHFDMEQRGFSFRFDAPLDMRMNQKGQTTAAHVVNTMDAERLTSIFRLYGELKQAPQIAAAIVKARQKEEIRTTTQLAELLTPYCGRDREKKDLARVFQALRIEVNQEMEALREMLMAATQLLKPGGRLVVLSYHSLEDRMVKNLIRAGNVEGCVQQDFYGNTMAPLRAVGKPVTPSADEQAINPRSRSAKLRVAEKI